MLLMVHKIVIGHCPESRFLSIKDSNRRGNENAKLCNHINLCMEEESLDIMRLSNCSAPIPPLGQPRGQRKYVCDQKGRGTRKKGDFGDYIGRGK